MKIEINFSNKIFYTLVILTALVLLGAGIYAYTQTIPNPGHGGDTIWVLVNGQEKTLQEAINAGDFGKDGPVPSATIADALNYDSGQKICSVSVAGNWRDTILVPLNWTKSNCASFMTTTGAAGYSLVCIFNDKIVFGAANGGLPSPNCGWS